MSAPIPLDRLAAQWGQRLVDKAIDALKQAPDASDTVENLVRATSSVFEHHGLTAGFLFLLSRTSKREKHAAEASTEELVRLICEMDPSLECAEKRDARTILGFLESQVTIDLRRLLQVHRVVGDALVFARLSARAMKRPEESDSGAGE